MEEKGYSINRNNSILVSRNTPLVLIVGVSGFLGSHLAERFLREGIQVIGVDDFSTGEKQNLEKVIKDKNFHLLTFSFSNGDDTEKFLLSLNLPRLDYAYFLINHDSDHDKYNRSLGHFLQCMKKLKESLHKSGSDNKISSHHDRPKILMVSSITLYDNKLDHDERNLKDAEIKFAKYVKFHKLNARIVRLSPVFGPRMHFRLDDPVVRLIQASLNDQLHNEATSLNFSSRALFVDDAVNLLVKAMLSGATAQKIYDGSLLQPIQVSEIKQILLDPIWYELKHFNPSELPPWPTPNVVKTMKELSWKAHTPIIEGLKKTVTYFRDRGIEVPSLEVQHQKSYAKESEGKEEEKGESVFSKEELKKWSFSNPEIYTEGEKNEKGNKGDKKNEKEGEKEANKKGKLLRFNLKIGKGQLLLFLALALITYAVLFPTLSLIIGGFSIRNHLKTSQERLVAGDFTGAKSEIGKAEDTLASTKKLLETLEIVQRVGILPSQIESLHRITEVIEDGVQGVNHAVIGSEYLYQSTKIISGQSEEDVMPLFEKSQVELTIASQKIGRVESVLSDPEFIKLFPSFIQERAVDLSTKLNSYSRIVDKARAASFLLPKVVGGEKKSYLIILQDSNELRPTGGFITSVAKLTFENGKISHIETEDVSTLDSKLTENLTPPEYLKTDLNISRYLMQDSNFDPDFPTSARQVEFFYKRQSGEIVNGVFALDIEELKALLKSLNGVDIAESGEHIDENNLEEKLLSSPAGGKKKLLTLVLEQVLQKLFYLDNQNWPSIISATTTNLEQKHLLIYIGEPSVFSQLVSENWAGVMPRGVAEKGGETSDFLSVVDANVGVNKVNHYLDRKLNLETTFSESGDIKHILRIRYENNSESVNFPGGDYKNRLRVYVPLGAKLERALLNESDITSSFATISDYGRTGYTTLFTVPAKDQKQLVLEYTLSKPLNFKDNNVRYKIDLVKQAGTDKDPIELLFKLPASISLEDDPKKEHSVVTDLSTDKTIILPLLK